MDSNHLYLVHGETVWRRNLDGTGAIQIFTSTNPITAIIGDNTYLMVFEVNATMKITSIRKSDTSVAGILPNAPVSVSVAIAPKGRKIYGSRPSYPLDGLSEISYNADGSFGASISRPYGAGLNQYDSTSATFVLPSETKVLHGNQFSIYAAPGLTSVSDSRLVFSDADFGPDDTGVIRAGGWFIAVDSSLKVVGAIAGNDRQFALVRGDDVFFFGSNFGEPGSFLKIFRSSLVSPVVESAAPLDSKDFTFAQFVDVGSDRIAILRGRDAYLFSGATRTFVAGTKLLAEPLSVPFSRDNNRLYLMYGSGLITQITPDPASFRESIFATTCLYVPTPIIAGAKIVLAGRYGPTEVLNAAGGLLAVSEVSLDAFSSRSSAWVPATNRILYLTGSSGRPFYQATVSGSGVVSSPSAIIAPGQVYGQVRSNDTGTRVIDIGSSYIVNGSTLTEIGRLPAPVIDASWNGEVLHTVRTVDFAAEFNVWTSDLKIQKTIPLPGSPAALFKLSNGLFLVPSFLNSRLFFSYVDPVAGTVGSSPVFKGEPFSQAVLAGDSTFFEAALESGTATYQWYKDGVAIPGATASVLTFTPAQGSDQGAYYVVATNAFGSVTSRAANLSVYVPPPAILSQSYTVTTTVGARASLSIAADSTAVRYEWYKLGVAGPVGSEATLVFDPVQTSNAGYYYCRAYNSSGYFGSSYWVAVTVGDAPPPPPSDVVLITSGLKNQTVTPGSSVILSVSAIGSNLGYTWKRNGVTLAETSSTLKITNAQASDAGAYEVTVRNGTGSQAVSNATLSVKPEANITNISTRMHVDTGSNIAVAGFVIEGGVSKRVLIRASGPALDQFIGAEALDDPKLEVYNSSQTLIASNSDWDFALSAEFANAGAFDWAKNSKDAALVLTLAPGSYTAQLSIQSGGPGPALVEVYDLEPEGAGRLANISTRAFVSSPSHVIIAGFVVSWESEKTVLVRGAGPSLGQFGLQGVLNDPKLSIFDGKGIEVASNSSWSSSLSSLFDLVGAFIWPLGSKDAALQVSLKPGNYTVHLQSEDGGTGIAIVEVYEMK